MKHIVEQIRNKNYNDASKSIVEAIDTIMAKKLVEAKKIVASRMTTDHPDFVHMKYKKTDSVDFLEPPSVDKAKRGLTMGEEDGIVTNAYNKAKDWVKNNAASYTGASIASNLASKAAEMVPKIGTRLAGPIGIAADIALNPTTANAGEEEQLKKMRAGQKEIAQNKSSSNTSLEEKNKKINEEISDRLKSFSDLTDKFDGSEINSPLTGTKYGLPTRSGNQGFNKFKSDLDIKDTKPGEASYNKNKPESEGESPKSEPKSNNILGRLKKGVETAGQKLLDFSDKSNEVLGKVNDMVKQKLLQYANEQVELDEARIKIVKVRVRGGKVQRRKKVSNVPGMTLRSGRLTRMSPTERRHRKIGQRKGKIKRRAKLNRTLMKRARSIRKREALGL